MSTKEEILRRVFKEADTDGSGKLKPMELVNALKTAIQQSGDMSDSDCHNEALSHCNALLESDTDGDRELDEEEFVAACLKA